MRTSRARAVFAAALILASTALPVASARAQSMLFSESFGSLPLDLHWRDQSTHGQWRDVFGTYGTNGIGNDGSHTHVLAESPRACTTPSMRASTMITSQRSFGDLVLSVQMRTIRQLRRNSPPRPWEVGWVMWHLTSVKHFYYVLLRTDAFELGREDNGKNHTLVWVDASFPLGPWRTIMVRQVGSTFDVWVDGTQYISSYTDSGSPILSGKLGLYTEDSVVHFDNVRVYTP